jgi:uncharacterized membrane protein YhiD involved in acid resistance
MTTGNDDGRGIGIVDGVAVYVFALVMFVLYGIIILVLTPLDRLLGAILRRRARAATRAGAQ